MTAAEYRVLRQRLGTQVRVAHAIPGLHPITISRRETGHSPIDGEAAYALQYLAEHPELVRLEGGHGDDHG